MAFQSWELLVSGRGLIAGVALMLVSVALHRHYFSDLSNVPGPFWASITRLWHVWYILNGKQNLHLKALHEKYGHFVRIAPNEVSVSHPDGSTLLLRAKLHKSEWYTVTAVPDFRFRNPMSTTDPKKKIALSNHFARGYSKILESEHKINNNIMDLLSRMNTYAEGQTIMELDRYITYTTFDNIGTAFFSESFGFLRAGHDIGGTLRNNVMLSKFAAVAGFFILPLRILVNPLNSWAALLPMGHLFTTTSAAIRRRDISDEARCDVLEHWINASRGSSGQLSLRDIEAQANVNVGAGAEPVSSAIQSFVYHMIQHPKAWLRVLSEIDAAQARGLCLDPVITFHDAEQLPYFRACVKEALRIFSPTTMGLPRVVPKDGITIGGRHFQGGTILSISPQNVHQIAQMTTWLLIISRVVHSSKAIWGADAQEWNPERWLSGNTKDLDKNWLVFSAGYMMCPGRHFARMQILKIAATMVRDYDIRQVDPRNVWDYQANFTALTHSWPVYVEKRQVVQK